MSDAKAQRFVTISDQMEQAALSMTNDMIALGLTPAHADLLDRLEAQRAHDARRRA